MIFVTIGSMLPFDRMIRSLDVWAAAHREHQFLAQIGEGSYEPQHMQWVRMLTPGEFAERMREASLVVAHAGMGSVISALEAGKPIVLLPRRPEDMEVTTSHQVATARWLAGRKGVYVAMDDRELPHAIAEALASRCDGEALSQLAPPEFVVRIRNFLTE